MSDIRLGFKIVAEDQGYVWLETSTPAGHGFRIHCNEVSEFIRALENARMEALDKVPFERWWRTLPPYIDNPDTRFIGPALTATKEQARAIWQATLNATSQLTSPQNCQTEAVK